MSGQPVSISGFLRAIVSPTARDEDDAARQHAEATVDAQQAQSAGAPASPSEEGDWVSGITSAVSGFVDSVGETITDVGEAIGGAAVSAGQAVGGIVDQAAERAAQIEQAVEDWYEQSPSARVVVLYGSLGKSNAFIEAVYADPALLTAAIDLATADQVIGFFGDPAISAAHAEAFPGRVAGQWDGLMSGLSQGAAMPAEVRTGLRRMLPGMSLDQAKKAFRARFAHPIVDGGVPWTLDVLGQVWAQLDVLPDTDIAENTILTSFRSIAGGGGFGPNWENPSQVNTIQLGQSATPEKLAHTVRHEVGHGVHAQIPGEINPWLQNEIGFWFYSGNSGFEQWINELGGFPSTYTDSSGAAQSFGSGEKSKVVAMLASFTASGNWSPSRGTVDEGQTPEDAALWAAMPAPVKEAVAQSPDHWYRNYPNWSSGAKGKYFLNYWYRRPFFMSAAAESVVTATGDNYTAMSEKEFFANAYAEYFEDPAGYSDHSKWGGSLPASVKNYFQRHIVERQPYTPPAAAQAAGAEATAPPSGMAGTP